MECHDADGLMMKYMDNTLNEGEAASLAEHLKGCSECEADFRMYDSILAGFTELELVKAPDGFEESIMEKIKALPSLAINRAAATDNLMCLVWGIFSVLFGVGFLAALNRELIMEYIYSEPALAPYAQVLAMVGEYVTMFSSGLALSFNQIITTAAEYISASRYALLIVLAVLAMVQLVVYRRARVGTDAD